jgi:energy-coupling factor transporter ATP-binding protein EcfA2
MSLTNTVANIPAQGNAQEDLPTLESAPLPLPLTWFEQQRWAFELIVTANQKRSATEAQLNARWQEQLEKIERDWQRQHSRLTQALQEQLHSLEAEQNRLIQELRQQQQTAQRELSQQKEERIAELDRKYRQARHKAEEDYQDRLWRADSLLEAAEKTARERWETWQRQTQAAGEQIEKMQQQIAQLLLPHGLALTDVACTQELAPPAPQEPEQRLAASLQTVQQYLEQWQRRRWLHVSRSRVALLVGVPTLTLSALVAYVIRPALEIAAAMALLSALVLVPTVVWLWQRTARRQMRTCGQHASKLLAEAERAARLLADYANAQYAQELLQHREKHAERRRRADDHYLPSLETQKQQYEEQRQRLLDQFEQRLADLDHSYQQQFATVEQQYHNKCQQIQSLYEQELAHAEAAYRAQLQEAELQRDIAKQQALEQWQRDMQAVGATATALRQANDKHFAPWSLWLSSDSPTWSSAVPWGIRCGEFILTPEILAGLAANIDPRAWTWPEVVLGRWPAFLPFPLRCCLLLRVRDEGRSAAIPILQNISLRFLTGLPPGKVRLTIIDPIGLGENFAALMHLTDYDERLIGGQIWTEPRHIEQRLQDLTEHITSVIQKYLRNQYTSIEEYNQAAGEVAEPYRVLIVANFPTGFTPEAAQRLLRIAATGPNCGVCVLVSADTRQAMPRDFDLQELENLSFTLAWKEGRFLPKDPIFSRFPLELESPPPAYAIRELLSRYGQASRAAARVEVPFDYIAPAEEHIWTGDASTGIAVPIGRAGATRRQVFRLGEGTAQHALVAGKTGSGKSTLLHALIVNLSLLYSPDEVELYLIDFKEGVEFQWYATLQLPHARVVAIESEREFGLSVLQRLDRLLQDRGEQFRIAGVNELAAYRQWLQQQTEAGRLPAEQARCPRILLIIDEFQQLFVEDDKIAQEAALLLDRLVRQGRAFGIHILLGSQTLGGSYSLPRSTLDQMAVRIALQCSDADAQLILNKDNTAARLLSRPGEAIYNAHSGLVEGNEPFQVVWLSEQRRVEILERLRQRGDQRWPAPIVFAGHTHADITANATLKQLVQHPVVAKVPTAWLGEPVAINPPTAVVFRPQSGSHLLLIGQNEQAARGLFTAICLSLLSQLQPDAIQLPLMLLDGTPDDAEMGEYFLSLCRLLPGSVVPTRSQLAGTLSELAEDLHRRLTQPTIAHALPRFLLIFGIQRFRELRRSEDDFGWGRRTVEREPTPAEQLNALLRDGAAVGLHVIVWCDSLTNLQRTFDRSQLRDFSYRVLFQMSANDSSHLMDTPAASRLGRYRALLLTEESERAEKFRPYGVPDWQWLEQTAATLRHHWTAGTAASPP